MTFSPTIPLLHDATMLYLLFCLSLLAFKDLFHFQFRIDFYVTPWDAVPEGTTSNLAVGKAITGLVTYPDARGASIEVTRSNLEKLAASGYV